MELFNPSLDKIRGFYKINNTSLYSIMANIKHRILKLYHIPFFYLAVFGTPNKEVWYDMIKADMIRVEISLIWIMRDMIWYDMNKSDRDYVG